MYGTKKHEWISKIWKKLPNYSNLNEHKVIWDDFSKFWCFVSLGDCLAKISSYGMLMPENPKEIRDLGIGLVFPRIKSGEFTYNNSSFLKHNLAQISNFDLPEKYLCICPFSTDKRISTRDFDSNDWHECVKFLKKTKLKGVVLNEGFDVVPECPELINLSNKCDLSESVEILKSSVGYVGIDSCLSVLAAKLFQGDFLIVKTRNDHCFRFADCYFAPKRTFGFLRTNIKCP